MSDGKPGRKSGPRIRTVKPELWQDERFVEVSYAARLLYIGLITQADDEGRQSANPSLLRARVFPFDAPDLDTIETWLTELAGADLIERWHVDGRDYLRLTTWADDQRVDRPTPSKVPPPPGSSADPREDPREIANDRGSSANTPAGPDLDRTKDRNGEQPPEQARETAASRPEVVGLCTLLADLMRRNDSKAKVAPESKGWLDAARLLLDTDGRTVNEVETVIRFTQADEFERTVVLSMPKLRARFGQLWLKTQHAKGANGHGLSHDEYRRLVLK